MLPQVEWKIKSFRKMELIRTPCDRTPGTSEKRQFDCKDCPKPPNPSPLALMHLHFIVLLMVEEA